MISSMDSSPGLEEISSLLVLVYSVAMYTHPDRSFSLLVVASYVSNVFLEQKRGLRAHLSASMWPMDCIARQDAS